MKVTGEREKAGLKLNIQNLRSWHAVPALDGRQMRQISFSWAPKFMRTVTAATKVKDACPVEE